jgi:6-pyruvoyltetrahydropterin/6-carboxytetrahydropterin synthase
MGLVTIAKQFQFHAAHQLLHHDGQCARPHGHTYKLEVIVTGLVKPGNGDSDEGMVLDFGVLKDIYKEHIEPFVEHRDLNESMLGKVPNAANNIEKSNRRDWPLTTCEHIAEWALTEFYNALAEYYEIGSTRQIRSLCVRLWETPTSYAEVGDTPWRG